MEAELKTLKLLIQTAGKVLTNVSVQPRFRKVAVDLRMRTLICTCIWVRNGKQDGQLTLRL